MIERAKYTDSGSILAIIDGAEMFVPDDMENRHRRMIAEWEAGGGVIAPYAPPPVDLLAYAAEARWQKEVGGIVLGGIPVATDDRSKALVIGARLAADADPGWSTMWVGADGAVYPIDAAAAVAISDAVQAHVNDCFTRYAMVKAGIAAGSITSVAEIDAAFA